MPNTITIRGRVLEIPPGSKYFKIDDGVLFLETGDVLCHSLEDDDIPIIAAVAYAEWMMEVDRLKQDDWLHQPLLYADEKANDWLSLLKELNS